MLPVIVIFAPTASGKTALAGELFGTGGLSLFKETGEVVSADSQAVYRGFDIGTAKPDALEKNVIPHHLIDIKDPHEQFDVSEFYAMADAACRKIYARKKFPLVTGGSGFYIKSFLTWLSTAPVAKEGVHEKNTELLNKMGSAELHKLLMLLDPLSASRINPNDAYRIVRALDVFFSSGKPLSSYEVKSSLRKEYDFLTIILMREREELYERINERVEKMFELGLPEEFERLVKSGCTKETPAMKAIGYAEFFKREEGLSFDEIKELIKKNTRRYAKKQYSYMKEIPRAHYVKADDRESVFSLVKDFCLRYRELLS